MELRPAGLAERLRERACLLGPERDLDRQAGLVLGHRHDEEAHRGGPAVRGCRVEAGERRDAQRVGELPRAVGAEVDVDDRVTVVERAVHAVDHGRREELVGLAAGVAGLDGRGRRRGVLPHPEHDGVVAALDAVPALVAVHRPVAAADGRDAGIGVDGGEPRLEVPHEPEPRAGRRVAAVEQRMDAHGRDAEPRGELHERDEVAVVGVDAAGADQPDGVQPARLLRTLAGREERRPGEERAVGDRGVDPRQVLEDRAARAEVEVADLGVAHLPLGQPHGVLGRAQDRVRARRRPAPASGAWTPRRSRPSPGRGRCRSRRGRRGRWVGACRPVTRRGRGPRR